jgi:hypothetical protein
MKRFILFFYLLLGNLLFAQTVANQSSQWDFFSNVIPNHRSITISGSSPVSGYHSGTMNWTMTIDSQYNVSFSGTYTISGWDHPSDPSHERSPHDAYSNTSREGDIYSSYSFYKIHGGTVTYKGIGSLAWENNKMKITLSLNISGQCKREIDEIVWERIRGGRASRQREFSHDVVATGNSYINITFDFQINDSSNNQLRVLLSQNRIPFDMNVYCPR